jgi:hypothetical protein
MRKYARSCRIQMQGKVRRQARALHAIGLRRGISNHRLNQGSLGIGSKCEVKRIN